VKRERAAHAEPLGELTSGDKKDLVLTSLLWRVPGRVAIYGWHRAVNQPIQPLSKVHGARYADYSPGEPGWGQREPLREIAQRHRHRRLC